MKKLLYSISTIALITACGDTKKEAGDGDLVKEPKTDNTAVEQKLENAIEQENATLNIEQPAANTMGHSTEPNSVEEDQSESAKKVITHGNPDQARIDSIKAAKQKGKK